MKPFKIDRFMFKVRREAGDLQSFATAEWTDIPDLLRLHGESFVRAAYLFVLRRNVDESGLLQYVTRSDSFLWKLRILLSLYCSPENGRVVAWKDSVMSVVRRIKYIFSRFSIRAKSNLQSNTSIRDMDAFYCAFENRFREDFDTILARLKLRYSATLEQARSTGNSALDLGCGRGEAVALFGAHGFQASGVDGNHFSLKSAEERGLDVAHGDLFAHLAAQAPNSLTVVSAFHVIEHLPFEQLMQLVDEAWRVLQPGGLLLLETPNARNVLVTGGDFYRDPTHIRPVFPDTLDFLLNGAGFEGQAFFFDENERIIPAAEVRLTEIQDYFHVSRDMAWIGRKTPNRRGW